MNPLLLGAKKSGEVPIQLRTCGLRVDPCFSYFISDLLSPFWGESCPLKLHNKMWGEKMRIIKGESKLVLNSQAAANYF